MSECICPRTDGYRIKRRGCPAHAEKDAGHWQRVDDRKFGTDSPHEPTDEFVREVLDEWERSTTLALGGGPLDLNTPPAVWRDRIRAAVESAATPPEGGGERG